jgi:hypothetical protein
LQLGLVIQETGGMFGDMPVQGLSTCNRHCGGAGKAVREKETCQCRGLVLATRHPP